MPADVSLTAVEAALALEAIPAEARKRIINRLTHGDPADIDDRRRRASVKRIVASSLLGFGAPSGELLGQEAAAMMRELWSAPGVQRVHRFWLEWNVLAPPTDLPATLMQLAAQIDYQDPDGSAPGLLQNAASPRLPQPAQSAALPTAATEQAPVRWHYGPTAHDSDPARMWCDACGAVVFVIDGAYYCGTCDKESPVR